MSLEPKALGDTQAGQSGDSLVAVIGWAGRKVAKDFTNNPTRNAEQRQVHHRAGQQHHAERLPYRQNIMPDNIQAWEEFEPWLS